MSDDLPTPETPENSDTTGLDGSYSSFGVPS